MTRAMRVSQELVDQVRAESRARAAQSTAGPDEFPAAVRKPAVSHCRSCHAAIWWGETPGGKRCPYNYDLVTATPTRESHFATCPQARDWTKR